MPFSIRPLLEADIPAVSQIEREAFPTFWPATSFKREMQNKRISYLVALRSLMPGESNPISPPQTRRPAPKRFIATTLIDTLKRRFAGPPPTVENPPQDIPVGFVSIWFLTDEAHITAIAVKEACRGRGLGELLLISSIESSLQRGSRVVTLEVRVSNDRAISLYQKYGFRRVGLRKAYYTDNREDAVIMTTDPIQSTTFKHRFQELRGACFQRHGTVEIALAANTQ